MSTIRQAQHEKICLYLLDNGGEATHSSLGDWVATALHLGAQEFSDLADEMVEEGLLRWDGTTLSLHSEGRALGTKVKSRPSNAAGEPAAKKGKKKKVEVAAVPPAAEPVVAPEPAVAEPAPAEPAPQEAAPPVAAEPPPSVEHNHSHGHSHDHGGEREEQAPPPRARPASPGPEASAGPAPRRGLLARVKCRIKRLLGR